jgi:hypothetical protein
MIMTKQLVSELPNRFQIKANQVAMLITVDFSLKGKEGYNQLHQV